MFMKSTKILNVYGQCDNDTKVISKVPIDNLLQWIQNTNGVFFL